MGFSKGYKEILINDPVNDYPVKFWTDKARGTEVTGTDLDLYTGIDNTGAAVASSAAVMEIGTYGSFTKGTVKNLVVNRGLPLTKQQLTIDGTVGAQITLGAIAAKTRIYAEFTIINDNYDAESARATLRFGSDPKKFQVILEAGDTASILLSKLNDAINFEATRYEQDTWIKSSFATDTITLTGRDEFTRFSLKFVDDDDR